MIGINGLNNYVIRTQAAEGQLDLTPLALSTIDRQQRPQQLCIRTQAVNRSHGYETLSFIIGL